MANVTCTVTDCDRQAQTNKGWCLMHYKRWKRHGDPTTRKGAASGELSVWLTRIVQTAPRDQGCILWPYGKSNGYGWLSINSQRVYAHRTALELDGRPEPPAPSNYACHHCDTPACVNPAHLYWGTQSQNVQDMVARKGHWKQNQPTTT